MSKPSAVEIKKLKEENYQALHIVRELAIGGIFFYHEATLDDGTKYKVQMFPTATRGPLILRRIEIEGEIEGQKPDTSIHVLEDLLVEAQVAMENATAAYHDNYVRIFNALHRCLYDYNTWLSAPKA